MKKVDDLIKGEFIGIEYTNQEWEDLLATVNKIEQPNIRLELFKKLTL